MKKFLIVLLSLITVCSLMGCESNEKAQRIAVVSNEQESIILFMDNADNILHEQKIELSDTFRVIDGYFYYSSDGENYQSYSYQDYEQGPSLENIDGSLMYYLGNDNYIFYKYGQAWLEKDGQATAFEGYVNCYLVTDDYFCMIDYSDFLYLYSREDFSLLKKERLEATNYLALTNIDDQIYVVSDKGYTKISEDEQDITYVYPNDFYSIDNSYSDLIFVTENNEAVVYHVSFDQYKMVLTQEMDEIYYRNIEFEEEFKEYYDDGYYVAYYGEL